MVDKINGVWSGADKPPWSSSVTFEDVRRCAKCAEGLANEAARQVRFLTEIRDDYRRFVDEIWRLLDGILAR